MINDRPTNLLNNNKKKILFLGYDKTEQKLIDELIKAKLSG